MVDDGFMSSAPSVMSTEALELKDTLTDMITWAERSKPRSQQVELGPSDLGSVCDRRIGYKIAEVPEVNRFMDPWTAFVGSAIHSRLQESIDDHERLVRRGGLDVPPRFLTEQNAPLDPLIPAHPDLLDVEKKMVIDHKSTTSDSIKKMRAGEPINPGYQVQVHLYGLAFERAGYTIEKVALAFYPRAGRLRDMFCWVDDYNRDIALAAWQRPYDIATLLTDLELPAVPSQWVKVPAVAGPMCGLCPWYDPNRISAADDTGCPGN